MRTCEYNGEPFSEPRSHPWTDAVASSACRYYDFKRRPELIRTALEDFVPWSHYPAVTVLYELLERLNAHGSSFETNDCAFSAPHSSEAPQLGKILQCEGRVMMLHRALESNLSLHLIDSLKNAIHLGLATLDPDFASGMIGTTIVPVRYLELPVAPERQLGYQLMLSFWAWGDSEREAMDNLERTLRALARALADVAAARPAPRSA